MQVTANQSFANTPTPVVRAIPSLDSSNVEQVQQFARQQRTRQEEGDGLGARNGGALTERSDRTANAIQQDRDRPDAARDQAAPDKRDEADAISANAPEIISDGGGPTASLFQAENLSIVTLVRATDPDPDSVLSYAIVGGADASLFSINSANGTLYFVSPPDFEGQQSAANNATYDVVVEVSDGFRTDRQALTVTVGDINERPTGATLSNGTVVENSAGGTVVGNVVGVDQDAGDSLTYSFAPNGDAGGRFAIDAVTGSITVVNGAVLNHEASNQQLVIVRITDQNGLFLDRALVIAVTDANDAPVITSNGGGATATITLAENAVSVATVTASDEDAGSSVSYAIVGGADAAQFTINATTGALSFIGPRDFENPADIGGDNRYEVVVQASDGLGGVDTQALTVDISNINDAPQNVTLSSNTVAENSANGVLVGTVSAVDPDAGATLTYSFAPGGDAAGRFQIDPVTGALTVADGTRLDYEANASHLIIVRVTDDQGLSVDTPFSITVTNVNEAPDITAFGGGPTALVVQAENTAALGVITAVDPEGAPLTYSIAGGADAARFTINATTGALSFTVPPDFENPADSDGDNHYHVVIEVSDGALSVQQALDIAVVNTGEAPVIISNGAGPNAAISINEGQQAVTTVLATDEDAGSALTYSIFGGLDAARFTIDATTGVLTLAAPPDFENPTDSNANNVYQVIVQASDGVLVDRQTIDVTVLNINDPPVIASDGGGATAFVSVAENSLTVTTVTAVDPDIGATLIYTITGGADSAKFTINSATGELRFIAPVSFEAPEDAGADNIYNVQVQALDGLGGVDTQDIAVQVTNQNEAPIITSNGGGATASVSIAENGTAVTTVAATDPDAGATLTYSISGGLDAARFVINAATGVLQFVSAPDFDAPADAGGDNVYNVNVQVSDGLGGVDVQAIAVTVTNLNEAPVITSNGAGATASIMFAENGGAVTTVTAADPDAGASITYTIIGGADAARFTLNPTTGVLAFVTPPDFEAPTDAGGDNVYDVIVQASDGLGGVDTQAIAVTVTNANEPPVITSNGGGATAAIGLAENATAVTTVTATDVDAGNVLAFSIAGGADAALFTINATTGALSFVSAPNFEAPADAGANNVYDVRVQVSDGVGGVDTQDIAVTISNVNEIPVITSNGGGATAAISFAENGGAVTTVTAADPDAGATLTFTVIGGADAARFTVNPTSGVLTFVSAPDFEAPADVGADNVYDVVIQVSDGLGGLDTQAIAVTVTNANDPPVITSNGGGATAAISIAENGTAVTTVTATDPDAGATITYSIAGGADAGLFTIDALTGALSFAGAPDFEAPADAGGNNVYDVIVQASDGVGGVDTQAVAVTVTNVNEAPVIASNGGGATATINRAENGALAVTTVVAADQDAGASLTYAIIGGLDASRFFINASTGALRFLALPDFEAPNDSDLNNSYVVEVQVSDGLGGIDTQLITVNIANANEAPVITSNGGGAAASISMAENGTVVTTVAATDVDVPTTLTYSILGGADAGLFTINAATGVLSFVSAPNFETPADAGADNVYDVIVRASDGTLTDDQAIALTITDVNEAPVITSNGGGATAAINVAENATAVTTVVAADPDAGASVTYSIVGGADAARFAINAATGALTFVTPPDFDAPADAGADNVYDVIVRASDGTLTDDQAIAVTVTDQNEAPVITSNGGGATAAVSIAENGTAVTTVTATDPDAGATITYAISGGADAGLFTIDALTGALSFVAPPDFEAPADAGGDNVYDVIVQASDGVGGVDTQAVAVTVTNVNEAPVIASNGGGATAAVSMAENGTSVTTVTASDVDVPTTLTYSIVGGADAARFAINATTGALSFVAPPDFEAPTDAGANNVYDVVVRASDGTLFDDQAIAVTVTNQNEAPVITSHGGVGVHSRSINEGTTAVTTISAADPDAGATITYSISGGLDAGFFTVNATTGVLSLIAPLDFETPIDSNANNIYQVTVRASDGTLFAEQTIQLTITDVNEAPVITSNGGGATAAINVAENATAVTTVVAADPDAGASVTYSIVGGADAARFAINAATGALTFVTPPDFDAPADVGANNVYDVIVRASDGTLTDDQAIAVTVTDQNEAPVITSNGGGAAASVSIAENGTAVTTVTATDPDAGATITYAISGGADAGLFTIDALTGALSFVSPPDFEAPADAGGDNVYDVIVQASDGVGGVDTQAIAVTVTNVNDNAPVITSGGGGAWASYNVTEGGTAVDAITASDDDAGATITYSIAGGADAARFAINATTGALSFVGAPDFEAPADADFDNVYDVTVRASDGAFFADQDIYVTVDDANDVAPTITSNGGGATASINIAENATAVTTVTATDPDTVGTVSYAIIGGADAALFFIDSVTGELSFLTPPDFENPTDLNGDNIYEVEIEATDGVQSDTQSVSVRVDNVNETAPVITSNGGGATAAINVAENGTAVTTVAASDLDAGTTITYSIAGGADAARFTINAATGVLSFVSAPNFEAPTDAGTNNVYDVIVRASDGTLFDDQAVAVTVTDQNEAPAVTSNGGGATAAINVAENATAVTTVTASDPDAGATLTYSIVGGADAARFTVNGATGALAFVSAPNFEAPTDAGANNVYDVVVRVSDGTLSDDQAIAVTVTDANEAPAITSNGGGATAAINVAENATAVTTVVAADPDAGASVTYSIVGGTDAARFAINAATGALTFVTPPDFDAPADAGADNVYDVIVRASDGTLTDDQAIAVTVTDQNEAPTGLAVTAATPHDFVQNGSFEQLGPITNGDFMGGGWASTSAIPGWTLVGATEDPNIVLPASIVAPDGAVALDTNADSSATSISQVIAGLQAGRAYDLGMVVSAYLIDGDTLTVRFGGQAVLNYAESAGWTTLTTTITGGQGDGTNLLEIISSAGGIPGAGIYLDAIRITEASALAVVENAANGTVVGTLAGIDPDASQTFSYALIDDAGGRFAVNASTGVLTVTNGALLDFEGATSHAVIARVTDQGGLWRDQTLTIRVANVGEVIAGNGAGQALNGTSEENTILGFDGDDSSDGGAGDDLIYGHGGNDTLLGGLGADRIDGGFGADRLEGVAGSDTLLGEAGDDTLTGGAGADSLDGGIGSDVLSYSGDVVGVAVNLTTMTVGGAGSHAAGDVIAGFENVEGGQGNDTLTGDAGANVIWGGAGADILSGLDGDDNIVGGDGADTMDGGAGIDWLNYGDGLVGVSVNLATNVVSGGIAQGDVIANFERVWGTFGDDTIVGSTAANLLAGNEGADSIDGDDGDDTLYGDWTADDASGGADSLDGGAGADVLFGEGAADTLRGGAGDDTLNGGLGVDVAMFSGNRMDYQITLSGSTYTVVDLRGGSPDGTDTVTDVETYRFADGDIAAAEVHDISGTAAANSLSASSSSAVVMFGLAGDDTLTGGAGADRIDGGGDNDLVTGSDGADLLLGGVGNDTLDGGDGDDTLDGGQGDDLLSGGPGDDYILGYEGNDTMVSGGGVLIADGGVNDDTFLVDATSLTFAATIINGGPQHDGLILSSGSPLTKADLVANVFFIESIDFSGSGVAADLTGFTAGDAVSILGQSAPSGNVLTLDLDGDDAFSAVNSAGFTANDLGGGVYQYIDNGTSQEVARVQII